MGDVSVKCTRRTWDQTSVLVQDCQCSVINLSSLKAYLISNATVLFICWSATLLMMRCRRLWEPFCLSLSSMARYWVFREQAEWTLTHTSYKDTEESTIEACITLDGVTRADLLVRWSPNEWPSVCWEIPVSANKMFWTSNKPKIITLYMTCKDNWHHSQ
jgi:hypothetical protein